MMKIVHESSATWVIVSIMAYKREDRELNFDKQHKCRMMEEETGKNSCCFIDKAFYWVHGDPAQSCRVVAFMMMGVDVLIEEFPYIWNAWLIPRMHSSMDPVEVSISPEGHQEHPAERKERILEEIKIVVGDLPIRVKI